MNQFQRNRQTYAGNVSGEEASDYQQAYNGDSSNTMENSYVNDEMKYSLRGGSERCEDAQEGFCLFSFTGNCKTSSPVCIGGLCLSHHALLFKKTYVTMPSSNALSIEPVSIERGVFIPTIPLTSFLPSNITESNILQYLDKNRMTNQDRDYLSKFIQIICRPRSMIGNGNFTLSFKSYLQEFYQHAINWLPECGISNIMVKTIFTREYHENNYNKNSFYTKIYNLSNTGDEVVKYELDNDNKCTIFMIPLSMFNLIDILFILGYHVDVRISEAGYAPNVDIVDGQILHGVGFGINNSINEYNNALKREEFPAYTDKVRSALKESQIPKFFNLDVLVVPVFPREPSGAKIKIPVCRLTQPNNRFDINHLYSEIFN